MSSSDELDEEKNRDSSLLLEARDIGIFFDDRDRKIELLKAINLKIYEGDLISVRGKSGSGKSTLLYILSSLEKQSSGSIFVNFDGKFEDLNALSKKNKNRLMTEFFGFVFQESFLIPQLTVIDNIMLSFDAISNRKKKEEYKKNLQYLVEKAEIENILKKRASVISSGERLRVALIRAICCGKKIIFLDEPTGALDNITARKIEELIIDIQQESKTAFVYVSHDINFANRAKNRYLLKEGYLERL